MPRSIYKIFADLQLKEPSVKGCYLADSIPFSQKHKIGISPEGYPMFFIECGDASSTIDVNLELISVLFNRSCRLLENNNKSDYVYTIISLKTENIDFQKYFFDIVFIILKQLPKKPTYKQLKTEIQKLTELFSYLSRPARKAIQGLWAELFVIERAQEPEYLIKSWHSSHKDKFDFNDGLNKIEVKSTTLPRRVHRFSLEQLNPNNNSELLIISIQTIETGQGKNIFDLKESICKRLKDNQIHFRLNEIISQTLGNDLERAFDVFFDYQLARDTITFYNFVNIPVICNDYIPNEISNIHFDCDLSNAAKTEKGSLNASENLLFKSL